MRARSLTASVFVVLSLAAFPARADEEHVTKTVKLEPGGTLRLNNFSGRVTITGTDGTDVVVDALRHASRDHLDAIKLDIHTEGSAVVIEANKKDSSWHSWFGHDNVVETDLDIKVPRRTNLDIHVFSSAVDVTGVEGTHRVHGFSSRVRLADVTGPIEAHSFSGPIEIRQKTWQDNQRIDVDTFSGGIELHVPSSANGTVNFNSFSGHLTSEMPLILGDSSRRSLTAKLGNGTGGTLRLKTFSGNVRIDR